jgi:peptidoglycan/xylan/chitin deacetylase (PgdA/CDA1 family)
MFGAVLTVPLYHHVAAQPVPATAHIGVTTASEHLESHLDRFQRQFDIVDLETVLSGRLPRRPLLLTFDDCFRTMLTVVAPMLTRRGLPAVIFLNPDPIDRDRPMFDHVLSVLVEQAGEAPVTAALVAEGYPAGPITAFLNGSAIGMDATARASLIARLTDRLGLRRDDVARDLDVYLTPAETRRLAALSGIEIGNHTASHVRCRSLAPHALQAEIGDARRRLEDLTARPVRAFSFPYGAAADATPEALAAIAASGHRIAFLAQGRRTRLASRHGLLWDRVPLDGTTPAGFLRRLMVEPLIRGLKDTARATLPAYLTTS